jgi:hypothetical protein
MAFQILRMFYYPKIWSLEIYEKNIYLNNFSLMSPSGIVIINILKKKVTRYIITSIATYPIGLAVINVLVIMSVSTFKTDVILYVKTKQSH